MLHTNTSIVLLKSLMLKRNLMTRPCSQCYWD